MGVVDIVLERVEQFSDGSTGYAYSFEKRRHITCGGRSVNMYAVMIPAGKSGNHYEAVQDFLAEHTEPWVK